MVVYHLPKFSGKSGWKVNGTQLFVGCVVGFALKGEGEGEGAGRIWARERLLRSLDFSVRVKRDVTKTGNGERGAGSGERGTGNGSLGMSCQRKPPQKSKMAVDRKSTRLNSSHSSTSRMPSSA